MLNGKNIDAYLKAKKKVTELRLKYEEANKKLSEMEDKLISKWDNTTKRIDGKLGSISLKETIMGTVKDWNKIYDYILKDPDNNFSVMERRLSQGYFRNITEDGLKINGIEKWTKKSLSIGFKRGVK